MDAKNIEQTAEQINQYAEQAISMALEYAPKLALALVTLVVGLWIIKAFGKWLGATMLKREVDPSLRGFVKSLSVTVLKILLAVTVASMVGIEMTSFIAILGAASLAVGLAMQGTLQNFAGGVLILLLKPFKVGDFIETGDYAGSVETIQIFHTTLVTPDGNHVILPNSSISSASLINFSTHPTRKLDLVMGIAYDDDIDLARKTLLGLVDADDRVLDEPKPEVLLTELGDSSVNLTLRCWLKNEDFWPASFELREKGKKAFDAAGLSIPFPQRDVHLYQAK